MNEEKQLGELIWFSREKGHGLIVRKDNENRLEKFFLHLRNISICEPAFPFSGCWALFFVSLRSAKKPTDSPMAVDVEVYKTLETAQKRQAYYASNPQPSKGGRALSEGVQQ